MKKIAISLVALSATIALQAQSTAESAIFSGGEVSGQIKAMHIVNDLNNGYTPNDGSGYLGTLKYVTPELSPGLKFGTAFYVNGDTGLTRWDETGIKTAGGMFVAPKGDESAQLGQAYLEYKSKNLTAKVGRQILDTPLTTIKWSLMPNFYEAAVVGTNLADKTSLTLAHVSRMSYGSRAATDWGLIGEKTGTAGTVKSNTQATFHNLGTAAGTDKTNGITAANITYSGIKNFKISLWDYYAHDIANMIYADVKYKIPLSKTLKLCVKAQYLNQKDTGDSLAGDLDYSLYATKVHLGTKKYSAYLAYSVSGDKGAFANPWGSDPSYTSSLFSRNQYRQDVSAYKVGGHYVIMKGLKLMASYANYGQSKTSSAMGTPTTDATETDIILAYKPAKEWTLKIFNTIRASEYNTDAAEKKMNHVRAIASYDF